MKRALFIFDGGNFYKYIKSLDSGIHPSKINYRSLCERIATRNTYIAEITYCIGEVRYSKNPRILRLFSGQQKLVLNLRFQGITVKLGYMLYSNGSWHEKGVDVQMAVDLVDKAADDLYDVAYLLSSDTDLIPAIKVAQRRGRKIVYVASENYISNALSRVCDDTVILTTDYFSVKPAST